jgi:hypothetical protein
MATAPSPSASMQFIFARGRQRPVAPPSVLRRILFADSGGHIVARERDQQASEGRILTEKPEPTRGGRPYDIVWCDVCYLCQIHQSRRRLCYILMLRDGTGDDGMGKHGLLGLWILVSMAGSRDSLIPTPQNKARADCVKAVLWVR